jgi:hypothetical protein
MKNNMRNIADKILDVTSGATENSTYVNVTSETLFVAESIIYDPTTDATWDATNIVTQEAISDLTRD